MKIHIKPLSRKLKMNNKLKSNKCSMFVVHKRSEKYQIYNFHDKELPMGNYSERLVLPILDRLCNPKGNSAYNLFSMHKKKNCNTTTVSVAVTPAQQLLLQELPVNEIPDLITHLKTIHYNGTYEVQEPQRSDLVASQHVLWFIQSLEKIKNSSITNLKTA